MTKDVGTSWVDRLLPAQPRLPWWLKLAYTGFMAVLVPIYWRNYGVTNFLYFCDVALFFTLAAVWLESPMLASAPLVGIFLPQMLWVADFITELAGGRLMGMTSYMFRPPYFLRALSFFHCWLPFFLLWLVWRMGYDRRGFALWTVCAWVVMGICYLAMPGPTPTPEWPDQPININYVYGLSDAEPQDWFHPDLYFGLLMATLPLGIFLPSHVLFAWLFARRRTEPSAAWASST
ncbi:MAG: hypothetical protein L0Y71_15785 [Gemmataceae bacterium]|nr:hypothetical protein [Gemmataceae bacterium]